MQVLIKIETAIRRFDMKKLQAQLEHEAAQRELAKKLMSQHEKKMKGLLDEKVAKRDAECESIEDSLNLLLSRAKVKDHVTIYGKAAELTRTELETVAKREIPYTNYDFAGKYHLKNIKSKYPIPGTQIRIEKERELSLCAKERLLQKKTEEIRNEKTPNRLLRRQSQEKEEFQRKRDMSRLEHRFEKINLMLEGTLDQVKSGLHYRRNRLTTQSCTDDALRQFWQLLKSRKSNRVKALLIDGEFTDFNVAVAWNSKGELILNPAKNQYIAITPLMYACRHLMIDVIETLLQYGAEAKICTANGDSAFHWLFKDWPEKLTASRPSLLFTMRAQKVCKIIRFLLQYHGDCTTQNTHGDTVLHYCAKVGLKEAIDVLLLHGAHGEIWNRHGQSPADLARRNFFPDLARTLSNSALLISSNKEFQYKQDCMNLLKKRGSLSNSWSPSTTDFLTALKNESRRAGHTRGQFLSHSGEVVIQQPIWNKSPEDTMLSTN